MLDQVREQFQLSNLEFETLSNYINQMVEDPTPFLKKLLKSDREYLEPFITTELENFSEEMFDPSDHSDEMKKHPDIYSMREKPEISKYFLVYKALVNYLRSINKEKRFEIYQDFSYVPGKDKIQNSDTFYKLYKEYLLHFNSEEFEEFIDSLFNSGNPFPPISQFRITAYNKILTTTLVKFNQEFRTQLTYIQVGPYRKGQEIKKFEFLILNLGNEPINKIMIQLAPLIVNRVIFEKNGISGTWNRYRVNFYYVNSISEAPYKLVEYTEGIPIPPELYEKKFLNEIQVRKELGI